MIVQNQFDVSGSVTEVFDVVTDIERVARCFPGAALDEAVDEDTYKGQIKVRLGPVQVSFAGTLEFIERDREAATANLRAQGKEQRGRGGADAKIQMALEPTGDSATTVSLNTDLRLNGAVAQYGRGAGIIEGVAREIIAKFAANLQADIEGREVSEADSVSGIAAVAKAVTRNIQKSVSSRKDKDD